MALLLIAGQLAHRRFAGEETSARAARLYAEFARHRALNDALALAIAEALRTIDPTLKVRVNGAYDGEAIHVYIVNLDALPPLPLRAAGFDSEASLQNILSRNLVAVSPNVILIDDAFLSFLIVDLLSDAVSLLQVEDVMQSALESANGDMHALVGDKSLWAKVDHHRVAFLYQQMLNMEGLNDRRGRDELRKAASAYGRVNRTEFHQQYLSDALTPAITHELGHLRAGSAGPFEVTGIASIGTQLNRREERHADEIAIKYIEERIRSIEARGDAANSHEFEPLIWFGKLVSQMALVEVFRDFRGLTPLQVLIDIEQHECGRVSLYPIDVTGFVRASMNEAPILTEAEWSRMRARVAAWTEQSHAPHLTRTLEYFDRLDDRVDARFIEPQLSFFKALVSNDPASIFSRARQISLDVETETVLTVMWPGLSFERAIAFDRNRTWIATLPRGGWAEVRSNGTKVEYVRFVVIREPDPRKTPDDVLLRIAAMFNAIEVISGAERQEVDAAFVALHMPDAPECRSQTRSAVVGGAGLVYHGILQSDVYSLEIVHPSLIRGPRVY